MDTDHVRHAADGIRLNDPDGVRWRQLLASLTDDNDPPPSSAAGPVVSVFMSWPQRIQAGHYRDLFALDAIAAWVHDLQHRKKINPAIGFTVDDDAGDVVGLLYDPDEINRWAVLRRGWYLVFTGDKLEVVDETSFHARYCDPAYYPQITRAPRRAG